MTQMYDQALETCDKTISSVGLNNCLFTNLPSHHISRVAPVYIYAGMNDRAVNIWNKNYVEQNFNIFHS